MSKKILSLFIRQCGSRNRLMICSETQEQQITSKEKLIYRLYYDYENAAPTVGFLFDYIFLSLQPRLPV